MTKNKSSTAPTAQHKKYSKYKDNEKGNLTKERLKLQRQIKLLKQLPTTYKNLEVGCQQWMDFYDLMGPKQAEMDAWANGPILHFQLLNKLETRSLSQDGKRKLVFLDDILAANKQCKELTFRHCMKAIIVAVGSNCSFIYTHGLCSIELTILMNKVCDYFELPIRFKPELKGERGNRLGERI